MQGIFRHNKGFSLIEISLALLIIAGLVGITLYSFDRVTTNNTINIAYQETGNLIDSFRNYVSVLPGGVNAANISSYVNTKAYPKTLTASINGGTVTFARNGLIWTLNTAANTDLFRLDVKNFPTSPACLLTARRFCVINKQWLISALSGLWLINLLSIKIQSD